MKAGERWLPDVHTSFSTPTENPKMTDNLAVKGIRDDQTNTGRRMKARGNRRKRFTIEVRYILLRKNTFLSRLTRYDGGWHVYSRYATESSRDQALAALVKKEARGYLSGWASLRYRKGLKVS